MTGSETVITVEVKNGVAKHESLLVKRVKEAKKNSTSRCEFVQALLNAIGATAGCTCFLSFLLTIPIVVITLGVVYEFECPAEECLTYWMMSWGSVAVVRLLITIGINQMDPEKKRKSKCLLFIHIIDIILGLGFIAGTYFVYHIYQPDYELQYSEDYCQPGMYLFMFWVFNFLYGLIAIYVVFVLCACITVKLNDDSD